MKNKNFKKQNCLSSEFEKRLYHLVNLVLRYFETGNFNGIFPALISCFVCCWCSKPVVNRVFKKRSHILLTSDSLRYLKYDTKSGLTCENFFTTDLYDGFDDFVNNCSVNENN